MQQLTLLSIFFIQNLIKKVSWLFLFLLLPYLTAFAISYFANISIAYSPKLFQLFLNCPQLFVLGPNFSLTFISSPWVRNSKLIS